MKIIAEILRVKGNDIWSIAPDATVYAALELMAEKNVGALLVVDAGSPVGIFSERDYARKLALKGKSSEDTPVKDLMTSEVLFVAPENSIEECMALMTSKHIRHLPVLENGQLVGIVTLGDVVKELISDQKFTIQQLERYISGGY